MGASCPTYTSRYAVTITIPVQIANRDTKVHMYEVTVTGWAGTGGPTPQTVNALVASGQRWQQNVTVIVPGPYAQPLCQISSARLTR